MKSIYIFICFIFISSASFSQEIIFGKTEGPYFTLATKEIMVTTAIASKEKIITIPFINDGNKALIFNNKNSSCSCIATEIPKEIAPGEKGELKVHFTPSRIGDYNETIYIQTNAKRTPEIFEFKAIVSE